MRPDDLDLTNIDSTPIVACPYILTGVNGADGVRFNRGRVTLVYDRDRKQSQWGDTSARHLLSRWAAEWTINMGGQVAWIGRRHIQHPNLDHFPIPDTTERGFSTLLNTVSSPHRYDLVVFHPPTTAPLNFDWRRHLTALRRGAAKKSSAVIFSYPGYLQKPHIPQEVSALMSTRIMAEVHKGHLVLRKVCRHDKTRDFKVRLYSPHTFWETLIRRSEIDEHNTEDARVAAEHRRREAKGRHAGRGGFPPGGRRLTPEKKAKLPHF